jgi:hypothetical protein
MPCKRPDGAFATNGSQQRINQDGVFLPHNQVANLSPELGEDGIGHECLAAMSSLI